MAQRAVEQLRLPHGLFLSVSPWRYMSFFFCLFVYFRSKYLGKCWHCYVRWVIYFAAFTPQEHILLLPFDSFPLFLETMAITSKHGWPSIKIPQLQMEPVKKMCSN